jgi:hypothetical protein
MIVINIWDMWIVKRWEGQHWEKLETGYPPFYNLLSIRFNREPSNLDPIYNAHRITHTLHCPSYPTLSSGWPLPQLPLLQSSHWFIGHLRYIGTCAFPYWPTLNGRPATTAAITVTPLADLRYLRCPMLSYAGYAGLLVTNNAASAAVTVIPLVHPCVSASMGSPTSPKRGHVA